MTHNLHSTETNIFSFNTSLIVDQQKWKVLITIFLNDHFEQEWGNDGGRLFKK